MARSSLPAEVLSWIAHGASWLHRTPAWRLAPLLVGMLFARGRRTVTSWLRAGALGELGDDFRAYYCFLGSLGRKVNVLAAVLLQLAIDVIQPGERLLFALDDTPTQRYGPHVEGAGLHRHPSPGPAEQK